MREVETQLRDYFDEVVERMTEEDIRIRASTARGIRVRVPRFRIKPAAAVATGFGIAMTLLGGVMVAAKLLGGGRGDVAGNGTPGVSTSSDPGSPWLLVLLMAGFGLLALGMWSMRRSAGDVRERGDEDMQTIERPEALEAPGEEALKLKKRSRWLGWLSGILAVAVLVLGASLVFGDVGGQVLTDEQEQMVKTIDAYLEAWNTGDGAAAAALMSPSGYHQNSDSQYRVRDGDLAAFIERLQGLSFSVSRTGEAAFVGNYVMTTEHVPADSSAYRPSIYKMSADGTMILWHLAP